MIRSIVLVDLLSLSIIDVILQFAEVPSLGSFLVISICYVYHSLSKNDLELSFKTCIHLYTLFSISWFTEIENYRLVAFVCRCKVVLCQLDNSTERLNLMLLAKGKHNFLHSDLNRDQHDCMLILQLAMISNNNSYAQF